ncbi:MAG: hypothetical protein ACLGG9_08975 [Thermoleophilia bacterium]
MSSDDMGGRMAAWKRTVVSVLTSLGAGAALAAWRERRRRRRPASALPGASSAPHSGPPAAPPGVSLDPDDTGAAIDAARERLRRRADEQRRAAGEGDGPSPRA